VSKHCAIPGFVVTGTSIGRHVNHEDRWLEDLLEDSEPKTFGRTSER
jgi:hypothetical protein